MRSILNIALTLLVILNISDVFGQNIHLSQYYNSPLIHNPARTGEEGKTTRFVGNYRSQWGKLTQPYTVGGFSVDKRFDQFGAGFLINHGGAGVGTIEQMNLLASGNYLVDMNERNRISLGIQGGFFHLKMDVEGLSFDNQYTSDGGFDPNASSGETFGNLYTIKPDFNWGFIWYNGLGSSSRLNTHLGIAMAHTFQPNTSLTEHYDPLARRYTIHGGLNYSVNERYSLSPSVNIMKLQDFWIWKATIIGNYELSTHEILSIGIANRWRDAFVVYGGIKFTNDLTLGVSYDIHYSDLKPKHTHLGSFEISIKYMFNKKKTVQVETASIEKDDTDPLKIDTDRDGVPDYMDECPKVYGSIEKNGCPFALHDKDGDGISDAKDKCPEVWGPVRNMGCPEDKKTKKERDALEDDRRHLNEVNFTENVDLIGPIKIDNIEFATNSAKIDPKYDERMQKLYLVLRNNPSYEVLLSGHTDHEGSAAYNLMLGENRANAIKEVLVQKGIDRNRVSIVSYGENKPLDKSKKPTKEEMARNRRTEIIVIKND